MSLPETLQFDVEITSELEPQGVIIAQEVAFIVGITGVKAANMSITNELPTFTVKL